MTQGGLPFALAFPDAYFSQRNLLATRAAPEGIEFRPNQPTMYRWGLRLERRIGGSTTVELGYAGNHGVNLIRVVSINNGPYPIEVVNGRLFVPVSTGTGRIHPELGRTRPRLFDASDRLPGLERRPETAR